MVDWEPNKKYIPGDIIKHNSNYYICALEHISVIPPETDFLSKIFGEWIKIDSTFVNHIFPNKNLLYTPQNQFRGSFSIGSCYLYGDIVTLGSNVYICTKDTSSASLHDFLLLKKELLNTGISIDFDSKSDPGVSGSAGVDAPPGLENDDDVGPGPLFSNIPIINITTENSGSMTTQTFTFDFFGSSGSGGMKKDDDEESNPQRAKLKRKLGRLEDQIIEFNKKQRYENLDIREKIILLDIDISTKAFILKKYDDQISRAHSSDRSKGMQWLNTICDLPFGKYVNFPVRKNDSNKKLSGFFKKIKDTLDEAVYGHEDVKQEILEFVAKMITNKDSKGQVLALQGSPGTAKTRLLKTGLAKALGLPFAQINFGGMNDANVLLGHDQTYVGSKPGKIVDIVTKMGCMNGIMYFDEVDKISESKQKEIFGVLTHLLDPEQNSEFTDFYLGEVKLDLSKMFFVIAFNDLSQVDHIVSDRMKIIHIDSPTVEEKIKICERVVLKELCKDVSINYVSDLNSTIGPRSRKNDKHRQLSLHFPSDVIEYIILSKTIKEDGVRKLRRSLETVINRINMDFLLQKEEYIKCDDLFQVYIITKEIVDSILKKFVDISDHVKLSMYL
jgi:hypothetical protein